VVTGHTEVVVYTTSVLVTLAAGLIEEGTQVEEGASVGLQPPLQLVMVKTDVKVVVCVYVLPPLVVVRVVGHTVVVT